MNNQPHIIIFYDKISNDRSRFLVKQFEKHNFEPKVDAVHVKDYQWFTKNCVAKNYCLFLIRDQKVFSFFVEDLNEEMMFHPDFAIFYNNDIEKTLDDWLLIKKYLSHVFDYSEMVEEELELAKILIQPAIKLKSKTDFDVKSHAGDPRYEFRMVHLDQKDIMLYEIKKPNTELPYTTVTRNYSMKGHLPFFTDLFICESWGVARADFSFLKKVWVHLEMDGDFDIDSLLKAATEKCYPREDQIPEPEPEVYRRDIETVVQQVSDDIGCYNHIPQHILNQ